jgi:uncharacterized membrane protein
MEQVGIDIAAPPDQVWTVLADIERWPEWTASVTSVERLDDGPVAVGSLARVKQPRLRAAVWRVTSVEPGRSFDWAAKSPGITTAAGHRLEPTDDGTRVALTIEMSGPLAGILGRVYARLTRRYMHVEAEGLKRRVEAR